MCGWPFAVCDSLSVTNRVGAVRAYAEDRLDHCMVDLRDVYRGYPEKAANALELGPRGNLMLSLDWLTCGPLLNAVAGWLESEHRLASVAACTSFGVVLLYVKLKAEKRPDDQVAAGQGGPCT